MNTRGLVLDLLGIGGLAAVGVGCWWIFPPAALIVVGGTCIAAAVIGAKNHAKRTSPSPPASIETGERWP